MTDKEKMIYDLQSEAIFAKHKEKFNFPVETSGIVNPDLIAKAKTIVSQEALGWGANHLVREKKGYPSQGFVDTELSIDAVILPERIFNKVIRFLDE